MISKQLFADEMDQMNTLFDNEIDPFFGPKPFDMPIYEFFSRSTREDVARLRTVWNAVFLGCGLCEETKRDIRARFRSKLSNNHIGALLELVVYSLLTRSDYKVESGPQLPSGKPDFKVRSFRGDDFYVEVTCALGNRKVSMKENLRRKIYETINSIESDRFRVMLSIRGILPIRIDRKRLKSEVERWLARIHQLKVDHTKDSIESNDVYCNGCNGEFVLDKALIILKPILINPPISSRQHGFIRIGPASDASLVITDKYISSKLKDKAQQLSGLDRPVLLIVNVLESFMDDNDILTAMFGKLKAKVPLELNDSVEPMCVRESDGFWVFNGRPRNRSIEAVLFLCNMGHDGIPSKEPQLILNPFVKSRFIPCSLPFSRFFVPSSDYLRLDELKSNCDDTPRKTDDWRTQWTL